MDTLVRILTISTTASMPIFILLEARKKKKKYAYSKLVSASTN